jgi:hypothetical protein
LVDGNVFKVWAEGMSKPPNDWRLDASCTEYDPDMWFSENTGWTSLNKHAIKICATCPVKKICLDKAMEDEAGGDVLSENHGIFGGLSARERSRIRREKERGGVESKDSTPLRTMGATGG